MPSFPVPSPQARQLLLSGEGSNAASHWQAKAVGSALLGTFTALARQAQWLAPVAVELLRRGQGRHVPESLLVGLYVEGGQGLHKEFSFMAYPGAEHSQREDPSEVVLLPGGQGRQVPESPMEGLKVEGGHRVQGFVVLTDN